MNFPTSRCASVLTIGHEAGTNRRARFFSPLLLLPCFLIAVSLVSLAQTSDTGLDQFGTFQRNHIVTMNLFNLNNHIEIPVFAKTARDLTFSSKLVWDLGDSLTVVTLPYPPGGNLVQLNLPLLETGGARETDHVVNPTYTCSAAYP